eukprot:5292369-Lingulodinium_polyedra.AAC.1
MIDAFNNSNSSITFPPTLNAQSVVLLTQALPRPFFWNGAGLGLNKVGQVVGQKGPPTHPRRGSP